MRIEQTRSFKKSIKKLHLKQKKDLDDAVRSIIDDTIQGEEKKGDLAGVRVFKFKMINSLSLLAYTYEEESKLITLLKISSQENFYRDLKEELN